MMPKARGLFSHSKCNNQRCDGDGNDDRYTGGSFIRADATRKAMEDRIVLLELSETENAAEGAADIARATEARTEAKRPFEAAEKDLEEANKALKAAEMTVKKFYGREGRCKKCIRKSCI